jgi:hypothetical protein
MTIFKTAVVAGILAVLASAAVQAQSSDLQLSSEQRQTIYQTLSQDPNGSTVAGDFKPAIGTGVPDGLALAPLSDALSRLIPNAKGYQAAMVGNQIILVDPKTKSVAAIVTAD